MARSKAADEVDGMEPTPPVPPFRDRDLAVVRRLPPDRHPVVSYLARLGSGSRRTMTEALEKLARLASDGHQDARTLPWHALGPEHTRVLRERLASMMAPATANKHLAALRGVLREARRMGAMSAEDFRRATDWSPVRGAAPRPSRVLAPEELRALAAACQRDHSAAGPRDAALLAVLLGTGLRRSEVVNIAVSDYDPATGSLRTHPSGRRSPSRLAVDPEIRRALDAWLERRGTGHGPLFNPVNKGGRVQLRGLSEQAVYVACRKRAAEAGLPPVTPEDLRRSLSAVGTDRLRRARPPGRDAAATSMRSA
jgi:integrase